MVLLSDMPDPYALNLGVDILGYFLILIVGFLLGLMGGGGSILTLPVLVYFFGYDPIYAGFISLAVVGFSSSAGSIHSIIKQKVDYQAVLKFGVPSILSVYITRKFIIPTIPNRIHLGTALSISKHDVLMAFFISLLLLAVYSMLIKKQPAELTEKKIKPIFLINQGIFVGFITGLVGAGGGFLIVPALVIFAGTEVKKAATTSLVIISINTLFGFFSTLSTEKIDIQSLWIIILIAIIGVFPGLYYATKLDGKMLKKAFAYFILLIAIVLIYKEFLHRFFKT